MDIHGEYHALRPLPDATRGGTIARILQRSPVRGGVLRALEGGGLAATVGTPHRRHEGGEVGVLALRLALAHDVDHHGLGHRTRRRARDVEWWSAVCGDGAPVLLQRDVVRALELCAMETVQRVRVWSTGSLRI